MRDACIQVYKGKRKKKEYNRIMYYSKEMAAVEFDFPNAAACFWHFFLALDG